MAIRASYAGQGQITNIARQRAGLPTGIQEGNAAGQYAGSEATASAVGTPTAASGSANPTTPTPTPTTTPTPTSTPAAPPTSYDPYLTSAQIASYTGAMNKDQSTINGAAANSGDLKNKFLQNSAANGARAATSFNNSNQSDAARGFGFSGIHDTAMADIQANALMNQNNYNTAYQTGLGTLAANVSNAQTDIGNLGLEYAGIAQQNAQALADANGGVVSSNAYSLPTVTPGATPATPAAVNPVTYFQNPNMGAINNAIASGAAAGTAAGV